MAYRPGRDEGLIHGPTGELLSDAPTRRGFQSELITAIKALSGSNPKAPMHSSRVPKFVDLLKRSQNESERMHILRTAIPKLSRDRSSINSFAECKGLEILYQWIKTSEGTEVTRSVFRAIIKMRLKFPVSKMQDSGLLQRAKSLARPYTPDKGLMVLSQRIMTIYGRDPGPATSSITRKSAQNYPAKKKAKEKLRWALNLENEEEQCKKQQRRAFDSMAKTTSREDLTSAAGGAAKGLYNRKQNDCEHYPMVEEEEEGEGGEEEDEEMVVAGEGQGDEEEEGKR
eukprot:jgi/Bigna1/138458/aug1.45_g13166